MGLLRTLREVKMSLADTFGPGRRKLAAENQAIIAAGYRAAGTVTEVKACWWIKVNTKAARRHSLDGARFPHIIYFTYHAGGETYQGVSCVNWAVRTPVERETVAVYYDKEHPERYAVDLYGTYGPGL